MRVGILHPGAMGAAVARQAVRGGAEVYWLPAGRSEATRTRAERAGLTPLPDLAAMLADCRIVLSICPPAAARSVAAEVAGFDGVFVEANAISPARTREIAGWRPRPVVDGGIIGPPPEKPGTTTLVLAGEDADEVARLFDATMLDVTVLDGPVGCASALKLAYASFNKISLALAAQAASLAAAHGVLDELRVLGAGTRLADQSTLPSVAARAWRWTPEMQEIGDAYAEVGLTPGLPLGAAAVLERWAKHKDDDAVEPDRLLDDLR